MGGSPVILVNLPPEIPPAIQASLMKNNSPVLLNPVGHHWVAPKVGISADLLGTHYKRKVQLAHMLHADREALFR
jgi:hypothetical protein